MTTYPISLPVDSVREVISTITTGTVASNKRAFAKSVWLIQGYAQGQLFGEVDNAVGDLGLEAISPSVPQISDEEAAAHLQTVLDAEVSETESVMKTANIGPILQQLLKWALAILPTLLG